MYIKNVTYTLLATYYYEDLKLDIIGCLAVGDIFK